LEGVEVEGIVLVVVGWLGRIVEGRFGSWLAGWGIPGL